MSHEYKIDRTALEVIMRDPKDGSEMVSVTRAIFSGTYPDKIYDSAILDTFHNVADETSSIRLRQELPYSEPTVRHLAQDEADSKGLLDEVFDFYRVQFLSDLAKFRSKITGSI